jgi:transcriptional regulator with XRE-family HTH domain
MLDTELLRLGQNLKLARKRRKWSIEKVAELINSSKGTIGNVENGSPAVGIGVYLSLMELYRFDVGLAEASEASCDAVGIALSDQRLAGNKTAKKQELSSDF